MIQVCMSKVYLWFALHNRATACNVTDIHDVTHRTNVKKSLLHGKISRTKPHGISVCHTWAIVPTLVASYRNGYLSTWFILSTPYNRRVSRCGQHSPLPPWSTMCGHCLCAISTECVFIHVARLLLIWTNSSQMLFLVPVSMSYQR